MNTWPAGTWPQRISGDAREHLRVDVDARGHLRYGIAAFSVRSLSVLGLRFLRGFRLTRTVEGDRLANERLEGGLVDFFSFVDVDRAA